ncbi:MAG: MATE family efflux transporter [Clostridium sp.]|nr:MATE family efflux transporter [Clostridium sp.]
MTQREAIRLSDHFDYKRLLRFTGPSILTMIFASIYSIVDGYFVSNYAGAIPFAALNIMMPFLMILAAVGFMFGSGGTALVSLRLGQKKVKEANEVFSLITYVLIAIGIVTSVIGYVITPQVAKILGATEELMPYSILYARINMIGNLPFMLQHLFQSFLITAEKPKMGFRVTVAAGVTNIFLDFLLVGVLGLGLAGAAWATVISQTVGGVIPLIYFLLPNSSVLRLGRICRSLPALLRTCSNGSSEFLSNASASIVGMLLNNQLLAYMGTNGVAAYGVIMYVNFVFVGIYFGFAMGVSPVIGYHYGAGNREELRNLFRRCLILTASAGIILTVLAEVFAGILAKIFVGYDPVLYILTVSGMRIYDLSFVMMGLNVLGSALFTSLGNGKVSALLSLIRSVVLQVSLILIFPLIFGGQSLWAVVVAVETGTLLVTWRMIVRYRSKYHYY